MVIAAPLHGCAPAAPLLTGTPRPSISPSEVKVYLQPPTQFQEIASLSATGRSVFGSGGSKAIERVIEGLKSEAAKLGANGVILGEITDQETRSIGTDLGGETYSRRSVVSIAVGGSFGIYKKTGKGTAIYVPPSP
jgi:uncharacterized protein YbjQ (UPF0145 family)